MQTFYLAGSFAARDHLRAVRERLVDADIPVTATWLTANPDSSGLDIWAVIDLMDIKAADGLIVVTDSPSTANGQWVEYGYAMGKGKTVYGVGPKRNLFCHLARDWFDSIDDLIAALAPVGVTL